MAPNEKIYHHYRQQGRPVIIVEVGTLFRGQTWRISVNHVSALGFYGHKDNLDWDRPSKLGVALTSVSTASDHVLIACQHSKSLQVSAVSDQQAWLAHTVNLIRSHTDRPIVVRPHPRSRLPIVPRDPKLTVQTPKHISGTYDNFDIDLACHAVVNYNSGPGVRAAMQCVPVIVDESSLAWPVSISIQDIEQPPMIDRAKWLVEICHTEYTLDEISQGTWLKRLESALC